MAKHAPMHASRSGRRAFADGEDDALAPSERHDLRSGLLTWNLLDDDELAALEVDARRVQQESRLQGEDLLAVQVLVQAVVVAGAVAMARATSP